jgi:hypothetical protein
MTSTTNDLSTPLLSNLPHDHERDTEGCMPCSHKLAAADDEESNDDSSQHAGWFDNCGLPAILFLQFGMAFSMCQVGADKCLCWSLVHYSIVMFVMAAALYRRSVKDCNLTCSVAFLLPEILVAIVMGLVLFGKVVPASLVLMCGMLCLAFFVVASYIQVLFVTKASPEEDCDEELQRDELEVGFEPVQTV